MTALAAKRALRIKTYTQISLAATASDTYYQGALVGWDTATGLLVVGQETTTFVPVGTVVEDTVIGSGGGSILVNLFHELRAIWFVNSTGDAVDTADIGTICYVEDDQTVSDTDNSNARSVAGRVWALDTTKGVLVEPISTNGQRTNSGLDA